MSDEREEVMRAAEAIGEKLGEAIVSASDAKAARAVAANDADWRSRIVSAVAAQKAEYVGKLHQPGELSLSPVCYCRECIVKAEQCAALSALLTRLGITPEGTNG